MTDEQRENVVEFYRDFLKFKSAILSSPEPITYDWKAAWKGRAEELLKEYGATVDEFRDILTYVEDYYF